MLDLNDSNVIAAERQRIGGEPVFEDAADVTSAEREASECIAIESLLNTGFQKYGYNGLELIADSIADRHAHEYADVLEVVKASFKRAATIEQARKAIDEAELGRVVASMIFEKLARTAASEVEDAQ